MNSINFEHNGIVIECSRNRYRVQGSFRSFRKLHEAKSFIDAVLSELD